MGRREIQTMKILTGRTPNEVILTKELKEHLALTDSYDYSSKAVRLRSRHLWKHVSSRLSQLRIVVSNWRK